MACPVVKTDLSCEVWEREPRFLTVLILVSYSLHNDALYNTLCPIPTNKIGASPFPHHLHISYICMTRIITFSIPRCGFRCISMWNDLGPVHMGPKVLTNVSKSQNGGKVPTFEPPHTIKHIANYHLVLDHDCLFRKIYSCDLCW